MGRGWPESRVGRHSVSTTGRGLQCRVGRLRALSVGKTSTKSRSLSSSRGNITLRVFQLVRKAGEYRLRLTERLNVRVRCGSWTTVQSCAICLGFSREHEQHSR